MRVLTASATFLLATCAFAEDIQVSPEGHAYHELNNCVVSSAQKYARLPDPVGDVAEAAIAACGEEFRQFGNALDGSNLARSKDKVLDDSKEKMRALAVKTAADIRLGKAHP